MRRPFIAGNWKMNMTRIEAEKFMQSFGDSYRNKNDCEVAVCPPSTDLIAVKNAIDRYGIDVKLGAQNMFYEPSGAFTGEISPVMLRELGTEYVIIGHSERRQYFHETNEMVNKKLNAAFKSGLKPIMCIGESLDIRESGKAEQFVLDQLDKCLAGIDEKEASLVTIAYEPIWAIGTGKTATSKDADDMCRAIRDRIADIYQRDISEAVRIQYGGSVKPSNISELMGMTDIDGALVGGASMKVDDFISIINY
jgi:triosephosphate isomerase